MGGAAKGMVCWGSHQHRGLSARLAGWLTGMLARVAPASALLPGREETAGSSSPIGESFISLFLQ